MTLRVRNLFLLIVANIVCLQGHAQSNSTTAANEKEPILSGLINVNRSTSLYDFNDGTRKDGMDYTARFNAKIGGGYSLEMLAGYSQDLKYTESDDFSDTLFYLKKTPAPLGKNLLFGYKLNVGLPTSKESRIRQNLQASTAATAVLMVNPERLLPGIQVMSLISIGRNFHEFSTGIDGRVNTLYFSNQILSLGYDWDSGISVSAELLHRNTWSYQDAMRDSFSISEELGYQIHPNLNLAIGHSNAGSTLKPNGISSNVQIIDENASIVYFSTTATF